MRMPEIMTEAFARGLVDKIMVEVLSVIDHDTQNGKVQVLVSQMQRRAE